MSNPYAEQQSVAVAYGDQFSVVIEFPLMAPVIYGPLAFYQQAYDSSQLRRARRWVTWAKP